MSRIGTLCLALITALTFVTPAQAEVVASIAAPNATNQRCRLVETANLGINFGNVTLDAAMARNYVNERIAEMEAMAKEIGMDALEVNSMNYNLYSNNNNYVPAGSAPPQLQLSGNISFIIADPQKGMQLMEKASLKGFNVNYSLNAYRQCN